MSSMHPEMLVEIVQSLKSEDDRPIFVAISGFGASGKSTLANSLSAGIDGSVVVSIDDFIRGPRDERSRDWATFDRERLRKEVLETARICKPLRYQRYNSGEFVSGRGGSWREVEIGRFVIVEGCSVIHPALIPYYRFSAWVDCPQERALLVAKRRDSAETELFEGEDTSKLWDEVWGPNDRDFFDAFRPDLLADTLVESLF